jgi:hypothetical protein
LLGLFRDHSGIQKLVWRIFSFIFAFNYFAFRTELIDEEFEQNNPVSDQFSHQASFSLPSLNWETFDKDNAPKAITVTPWISLELVSTATSENLLLNIIPQQKQIIRDKSPPR